MQLTCLFVVVVVVGLSCCCCCCCCCWKSKSFVFGIDLNIGFVVEELLVTTRAMIFVEREDVVVVLPIKNFLSRSQW